MKVLVHGVPDTPAMWQPLLDALALPAAEMECPALPGFSVPLPEGFDASKEAYTQWLIDVIETKAGPGGQVDLVGPDWGALLVIRAACLRPDLVRTWAVANALPEKDYKWHRTARIWQTPVLGEIFMALSGQDRMATALAGAGMPEDLAKEEASHWDRRMRRSILKLYRSARTIAQEWPQDLHKLPARGLVFWGDDDPFVPVETAERFCREVEVPLHRKASTGHWSVVEQADAFAALLKAHWD